MHAPRAFFAHIFAASISAACILAACLLAACTSTSAHSTIHTAPAAQDALLPAEIAWRSIAPGISCFDHTVQGIPAAYHVVRIELAARRIRLDAYPPAGVSGSFAPQDIRSFAAASGSTVVVNTTPFSYAQGGLLHAAGIHRLHGMQASPPAERYAALAFSGQREADGTYTQLHAAVIGSQTEAACAGYSCVFGGFFVILQDGTPAAFSRESMDSRTAAGTNSDGSVLWLLCAEGERKRQSAGLSFQQCAHILRELGCTDALQFDGGGASQLCIGGQSVLTYTPPHAIGCCLGISVVPDAAEPQNH